MHHRIQFFIEGPFSKVENVWLTTLDDNYEVLQMRNIGGRLSSFTTLEEVVMAAIMVDERTFGTQLTILD